MPLDRTEARRLYRLAIEQLARLDLRLFAFDEADQLDLDKSEQSREMQATLKSATDSMAALARVDIIAQTLIRPVDDAVAKALQHPTDVVSIPVDGAENQDEEAYLHVVELRTLAARLAAIYGIDIEEKIHGLTTPQVQLRRICENIGTSILHLVQKRVIKIPAGEHDVKHLLYSCVKAAFSDALPDGSVAFPSLLKGHVPDLSVPIIKACVETKVARSRADLATVVEGLLGDMSTYGSTDYTTFFAVIYTGDSALTQELLDQELDVRWTRLGFNSRYHWKWLLVQGPLK